MSSESSKYDNLESILHDESSKPDAVPLRYVRKITNNFSAERLLGKGGTGDVYKGVLQSGEIIAVKRLEPSMVRAQSLFENEVHHLMRLKHPNIVRLIGYCYETKKLYTEYEGQNVFAESSEMLLCLEYLPKGSLDGYLSDGSSELDWHTRYKIIEGICNGLHYLHEKIDNSILHLDLKPGNVLLDDNLAPKITDFGLSRLLDQHQNVSSPNRVGTFGYMAPEYIDEGTITPKSDIFSLGVIIMELITGGKNYPGVSGTSSEGFIELELKKWRKTLEKAQGYTKLEINCQQIKKCIQIGLICVNPDWTSRPTTTKIIKMLQELESSVRSISNEGMPSIDQISLVVTKHISYCGITEEGKQSSKNTLCIENLEQAKRSDLQLGEASVSLAMAGDPLCGKALYLENQERSTPRATNQGFPRKKRMRTSNCSRDAQIGESSVSLSMATDSTIGPQLVEASVSLEEALEEAADGLLFRLLYLENRVALAKITFPAEARVAMDVAEVDNTLEFTLDSCVNAPPEIQRATIDLNETPFKMNYEHLYRMRALSKTVELGKRFFPRCSNVLDKIMDDEAELPSLGRDTSTENKWRSPDLQELFLKALNKDKERMDRSAISSSSSSTWSNEIGLSA